jgi:L-2-hydroxyglutarate oxidase
MMNDRGSQNLHFQILIVGAGITGLTLAREVLRRGGDRLLVVEKEDHLGAHASGRNSGVLHAGVYYHPGTLKARFCLEGNRQLRAYCQENSLTLRECGKVIVAKDLSEVGSLRELKDRSESVGAEVRLIDEYELGGVEPQAKTFEVALYSPNTAVFQPVEVLDALRQDLLKTGKVTIQLATAFEGLASSHVARTSRGQVRFDCMINAAGTYADRIAHGFGLAANYRIVPFKGTYLRLRSGRTDLVRGTIYPVPDLRNPFLGVHFTHAGDDEVYIGPTAIPAFGRENYGILDGINGEAPEILWRDVVLFLSNPGFRSAAINEPRKLVKNYVFQQAKKLVPALRLEDVEDANKVGIRAQLVDWPRRELVKDFVVLKDGSSLHILNAISPGFTSSMAFAEYAIDQLTGGGLFKEEKIAHAV